MPGIGSYSASVVLATLFGRREPFLDVNMARVLERFFGPRKYANIRDDPYLHTLAARFVASPYFMDLNLAMLDLGALVCRPRPHCDLCPLGRRCRFNVSRVRSARAVPPRKGSPRCAGPEVGPICNSD